GNTCLMYKNLTTPPGSFYAQFVCYGTALTQDEITITFNDTTGLSASTSGTITYPNQPPTVPGFLQPSGGQSYIGTEAAAINISWAPSTDADGDALSYSLYYSPDSGASWVLIATDPSNPYTWDASSLPPGNTYRINLSVTDGYALRSSSSYRDIVILYRNVYGNSSTINTSFSALPVIEINGSEYDGRPAYTSELPIAILDNSSGTPQPVVSFDYNFTYTYINFSAMSINTGNLSGPLGNRVYLYIIGLDSSGVVGGKTLTLYGINTAYTQACVKDVAGATAEEITPSCNGAGETLLNCDGTLQSGYICNINGTVLTVSGVRHSAVVQYGALPTPPLPPTPKRPSASTTGGAEPFSTNQSSQMPQTTQEPTKEPEEVKKPEETTPSEPPAIVPSKEGAAEEMVSEIEMPKEEPKTAEFPWWLLVLLVFGAIGAYLLLFRKKKKGL
ncbi:MAG: fibronectin type III domain-containing protein, partial [Candidatus Micrarchaeota archaeon]|nr:fibronectin type III domain-containing protein [Candidatus Micrarchaeota archaeon]